MNLLTKGSTVKAVSTSNTWMYQLGAVGVITEIFSKEGKPFAKISVPKWQIKKTGKYVLREWEEKGWSKPQEDFLLLDEGIELVHLELAKMPEPTIDDKVDLLVDQAFGPEGKRLGIWRIYHPENLVITSGVCVCEGCNQSRTHLAWHNCWGTVQAFMVCATHYEELNGTCSDSFPLKMKLSRRAS